LTTRIFDLVDALRSHRHVLEQKINRLQELVRTVDSTIMHVVGEIDMSKSDCLKRSAKKTKEYERRARLQYDPPSLTVVTNAGTAIDLKAE